MNTTEVVALAVSALAGGGMAAGGLAVRRGLREAVWKGYALSVSLTFSPPRQPRQAVAAASVPAGEKARSALARDTWKDQPREAGRFASARREEAA